MVRKALRSRSLRKVRVKVTKGVRIHFKERPAGLPRCSSCKNVLKGIKRNRSYSFRNIPKSQKKVNRPYGGNLCSKCLRLKIKMLARGTK